MRLFNKNVTPHTDAPAQGGKKLLSAAKGKLHLGERGAYCTLCNFCSDGNLFPCSLILVFLALSRKMHLSATPNRKMGVLAISVKRFRPGDQDPSIEVLPSHVCFWTSVAASPPKLAERARGLRAQIPVTQPPRGTFSPASFYRDGMHFSLFFSSFLLQPLLQAGAEAIPSKGHPC